MCLYNRLILNKKYLPNIKNGGNPPLIQDVRTMYVPVGCGDCIECRKQKAREWSIRLQEEIRTNTNGKFVTLTFNTPSIAKLYKELKEKNEQQQWEDVLNEKEEITPTLTGYNLDNAAATLAVRRFLERWRKKHKKSVRHWLITEIGGNNWEHIHIHGIIFTDEPITPIWQYGTVKIGRYEEGYNTEKHWVDNDTIQYIVKYLHKKDLKHSTYKSKILCSAGIGRTYVETYNIKTNKYQPNGETDEYYRTKEGKDLPLPIYYRNKIYTDEQKELLWLEKLDKCERYVCGTKIEVKTDEDLIKYNKLVKYHQKRSRELGYGTGNSWKNSEYEEATRRIMQETRIKAAENPHVTFRHAWGEQKKCLETFQLKWNN